MSIDLMRGDEKRQRQLRGATCPTVLGCIKKLCRTLWKVIRKTQYPQNTQQSADRTSAEGVIWSMDGPIRRLRSHGNIFQGDTQSFLPLNIGPAQLFYTAEYGRAGRPSKLALSLPLTVLNKPRHFLFTLYLHHTQFEWIQKKTYQFKAGYAKRYEHQCAAQDGSNDCAQDCAGKAEYQFECQFQNTTYQVKAKTYYQKNNEKYCQQR